MTPFRTDRVLAGLGFLVVAFGLAGCSAQSAREPRKPKVKVTVQKDQNATVAVEPALPVPNGLPAPPTPPTPPTPATPPAEPARALTTREKSVAARAEGLQPAIRLPGIRSSKPHRTKELALNDALSVARTELMRQLDQLDPPIQTRPSIATMKTSFLKGDIREILPSESEKEAIQAEGLYSDVRWVEIDLELTEDQIQRLRSAERVTDSFRVAGLLFALIVAAYGFLRLDQWTKGYLTMWLGIGAGAAVLVVALIILR